MGGRGCACPYRHNGRLSALAGARPLLTSNNRGKPMSMNKGGSFVVRTVLRNGVSGVGVLDDGWRHPPCPGTGAGSGHTILTGNVHIHALTDGVHTGFRRYTCSLSHLSVCLCICNTLQTAETELNLTVWRSHSPLSETSNQLGNTGVSEGVCKNRLMLLSLRVLPGL